MHTVAITLITLGGLLLLGLVTDLLGRHTPMPRVTLLLIFGFLIGPSALDLLPSIGEEWFQAVANMALVMVGFLLGGKLTLTSLRHHGRFVMWISIAAVVSTVIVVFLGLIFIGVPLIIALLLAGIAPATDPAATADVIHEKGAKGLFAETLLGIVAIDDAWGLIVFSLLLTAAQVVCGGGSTVEPLITAAWEVGGAILIGLGLGIPMAYITGRIQPGEPTQAEALGIVFLCGGIALWLDVSFLLASMVLGCVVANTARHHTRPFHEIEGIEWPFMILFFALAGASLQIKTLYQIGLLGSGYVVFRAIGRFVGVWSGGIASRAESEMRRWMGMALMPQAGVALGMALVAIQRFPNYADVILPTVIASTVLFEIVGPILTRIALIKVGDIRPPDDVENSPH
ncbi:MAG: cation:proton antiporter [Thermodesulfobacteriota bacterium]|nr:cation:proton antiporter [Thermodesulfobacteriota bacterium]